MTHEPAKPAGSTSAGVIRRASNEEAIVIWGELVRGGWILVDRFDDDVGRSFVLVRHMGHAIPRPWHRLSARERAVVDAVAAGHTNRHIAATLGISISTVAGHLRAARRKLDGARRVDFVREWVPAKIPPEIK